MGTNGGQSPICQRCGAKMPERKGGGQRGWCDRTGSPGAASHRRRLRRVRGSARARLTHALCMIRAATRGERACILDGWPIPSGGWADDSGVIIVSPTSEDIGHASMRQGWGSDCLPHESRSHDDAGEAIESRTHVETTWGTRRGRPGRVAQVLEPGVSILRPRARAVR